MTCCEVPEREDDAAWLEARRDAGLPAEVLSDEGVERLLEAELDPMLGKGDAVKDP